MRLRSFLKKVVPVALGLTGCTGWEIVDTPPEMARHLAESKALALDTLAANDGEVNLFDDEMARIWPHKNEVSPGRVYKQLEDSRIRTGVKVDKKRYTEGDSHGTEVAAETWVNSLGERQIVVDMKHTDLDELAEGQALEDEYTLEQLNELSLTDMWFRETWLAHQKRKKRLAESLAHEGAHYRGGHEELPDKAFAEDTYWPDGDEVHASGYTVESMLSDDLREESCEVFDTIACCPDGSTSSLLYNSEEELADLMEDWEPCKESEESTS